MNQKKSLLSNLFAFAGRHKYLTIMGMILSGVSSVISIFPIVCIWLCVLEIFKSWPNITSASNITYYAWMSLAYSILSMLIYFAALLCTHFAAFRIAKNMRIKSLNHLMRLPLGYFNASGSGKLRRVVDESAGLTETYLAHQLPDLVGAIITPIATVIILFTFNWKLGIISILPIAFSILFLMQMVGPSQAEGMKNYQSALEKMNNEAVEYVRGIPVVKTFGQSIFSFKKFYESIVTYRDFAVNYSIRLRNPMCCYTVTINSIPIFLALGGVVLMTMTSSYKELLIDFIFYLFFTPICFNMMNKIMWVSEEIVVASDSIKRINNLLDEKPLPQTKQPKHIDNFDICIENVDFTYPNSNYKALKNVSINIKQGTTTALVGPSGGGKSTTAALVARFFDVNKGRITIGGVDIREISEDELMDNISFVFQNNRLFKASILENIKKGRPNATIDEVNKAIEGAHCKDIIDKFEKGLDTVVGTKGVYLSGGEAQRIALARAILKDAPIILLDEATAFADPENEYKIQKALEALTKNKTVLIIAHRLSTIKNADNIHVLSSGELVETGKHQELIDKKGVYNDMWNEYEKAASWKLKEVVYND
ncbi:MAG: ABC transporter ATP-binding protein/permease [Tepidibacter sp.]|jgi:ATP-binding cassette subfamily B protein|uniref:ABC transporter ATP-binding protein n=1 Tax=Tepidibacter sp. TaxID=2529387 RepID=UPI0025DD8674|nr:ABC transporter ATP-binding protein [Tepidibacter sp.]MCT4509586.1 ABC transporter ATP-binding protein/permease [Tepidibacter sp.]